MTDIISLPAITDPAGLTLIPQSQRWRVEHAGVAVGYLGYSLHLTPPWWARRAQEQEYFASEQQALAWLSAFGDCP